MRIISRTAALIALVLTTLCAPAQQKLPITAREAFVNMPKEMLDLIDKPLRLDMLDYWDADSVAKVKNNMEGRSWLTAVTPDFLEVHLTDVSTCQIKILPSSKYGCVVATAYTIEGEGGAGDTSLYFYDTKMSRLPENKLIRLPEVKDFILIPKGISSKPSAIAELIPYPTVKFSFSPETTVLSAQLTVGKYMDKESFETVSPCLRRDAEYLWNGSQYRLRKQ